MKKFLGYALFLLIALAVAAGLYEVCINNYIQKKEAPNIAARMTEEEGTLDEEAQKVLKELDPQCIMVLGCGIYGDDKPTPMLRDRLETGLALYRQGVAPKLLLTGDNGQEEYNEIRTMYNYACKAGVPEEDIFCDHAGFSTYESMYRADLIFQVERMVVVTQQYHMYRSLYDAEAMGIRVLGVSADQERYGGQSLRELREVLARNKDFLYCMVKPAPTYGGEAIPITGPAAPSHEE